MLEDVTGSDLNSRISELSTTVSYLEGKLSDVESSAYQLSVITYALTLAQSSQAAQFLAKLEDLQQSEGIAKQRDLELSNQCSISSKKHSACMYIIVNDALHSACIDYTI